MIRMAADINESTVLQAAFTPQARVMRADDWPACASAADRNARYERIHVSATDNIEALRDDWLAFQDRAVGTPFQSYQWCAAWMNAIGAHCSALPVIVTGSDRLGKLCFLLPLTIRRNRLGVRVAEFLGSDMLNYGFGLFAPGLLDARSDRLDELWPAIVARLGPVDVIHLAKIPGQWSARPHPLSALFDIRHPDDAYTFNLDAAFRDCWPRQTKDRNSDSLSRQERRLARQGEVAFRSVMDVGHRVRVLETMFDQSDLRLRELGVTPMFRREESRAFFRELAAPADNVPSLLRLDELCLDGTNIATTAGLSFSGSYFGLVLSMAAGKLRRRSPGAIVLRHTIRDCAEAGLNIFDFGAGHGDYKIRWADETIPLHDIVKPASVSGGLYCLAMRAIYAGKRSIKRSAFAWRLARRARSLRYGIRPGQHP